jgi:hypothetical protein
VLKHFDKFSTIICDRILRDEVVKSLTFTCSGHCFETVDGKINLLA